ncbi:MAG: ABC transporter substrate-binding protein [Anaerolineae bacterium]|nr:ABC transporter substrate-binding protein [Anaerolineae bacterium]
MKKYYRILTVVMLMLLISLLPVSAQDNLAEDQTVTVIMESSVSTLHPSAVGGAQRSWTRVTFAAPFVKSPEGELVPWLATGYEASEDGLEYTLSLDPAAIFSDGTPITAESLKEAWEWGVKIENIPSWGGLMTIFQPIVGMPEVSSGESDDAAGLVVVDDHTLKIVLSRPVIGFQDALGSYLTGIVKADDDLDNPDYWRNPTTAGPYTLTWDPDTVELDLTKNDNWWGDPATVEHIEFRVIDDAQTKLIAYENGEVDIFKDTGTLLNQVSETHPDEMIAIPGLGFFFLSVSNQVEPTTDVHLRRALLYAIDHEQVIGALFPNHPVVSTIVQSSTPCYNPDLVIPYDPALAQEELAMSSYGSAENVPPVQVYFYTSIDFWGRILTAYQQQWQENLGIEVQLNGVDTYDDAIGNIYRFSGGPTINDPSDILTRFAAADGSYSAQAGYTPTDELASMIEEANAMTVDDPGRCDLYQEIESKLILEEAAVWPQIGVPYNWLVKPYIQGFETNLNQDINWEDIVVLAE